MWAKRAYRRSDVSVPQPSTSYETSSPSSTKWWTFPSIFEWPQFTPAGLCVQASPARNRRHPDFASGGVSISTKRALQRTTAISRRSINVSSPRGRHLRLCARRSSRSSSDNALSRRAFQSAIIAKALVDSQKRGVAGQVILDKSQRTDPRRGRFSGLLREAVLGPSGRTGLQPVEFGDRLKTCPTRKV